MMIEELEAYTLLQLTELSEYMQEFGDEELSQWEYGFLVDLVDTDTEEFTERQSEKIHTIHERLSLKGLL